MPSSLPQVQPPPVQTWWQRHWLWAIPACYVSLVALLAVFGGSIFCLVMSIMKSSDAYKTAVQRAEQNTQVISALGTPMSEGWFLTGNINVAGTSGRANFAVPIAGSKAKGTIYVIATESDGDWGYSKMDLRVDGTGERIDLLQPPPR